jgi:Aspartyl protease
VVDLSSVTYEGATVDGVLGYPFFAAAEVRIDPQRLTMTISKPGTLPRLGTPVALDTDRELPEVDARINNINGRFLLDTGNSSELLVFHAFLASHPGVVDYAGAGNFARNGGVGGSAAAVPATVNEIDLGPFALYNRYADVILSDTGAFADRNDAGNIGLGTLHNFVFTFDLTARTVFLDPTRWFDNGRFRAGPP